MKATNSSQVKTFQDIPNIGPAMERDFKALGLRGPNDLKTKDAFKLYRKMCRISGARQDPCVLDTYMAAIDFMQGAPARPWFYYTKKRKMQYPSL